MIKPLTKNQRGRIAEKLMDLGNIAAGALLFGQAVSGFEFDFTLAVFGLLLWLVSYWWALDTLKQGGDYL